MKRSTLPVICLWTILFAASCALLYFLHGYHYLFISQEHMFLNDSLYFSEHLSSIGGISSMGADWIVQFFCTPYIGPLSVSVILLLTGLFVSGFFHRTFPARHLTILALIPVVVLFFLSFKDDFDFSLLVGILFVSFFLAVFSRIRRTGARLVFAFIILLFLIYATGWPAALFALGVLFSFVTYEGGLKLNVQIPSPVSITVQLILLLVPGFFAFKASAGQEDLYKELDWYVWQDQPDNVLEALSEDVADSFVYENFANWALARKGVLLDNMFSYPQHNPYSLILQWKEIAYTSVLLSNIYWSAGHIALSQRMAFEADVIYNNFNPRMLQRLVQTNLVNGYDDVARKYLDRLGNCRPYRNWAEEQRHFLGDSLAVSSDPVLGAALLCLPAENTLSDSNGDICGDFVRIAHSNPSCTMAIEYAAAWMLLAKDSARLLPFMEEFYAGKKLPKALAEAVMILSESKPDLPAQWNVDTSVAQRYGEFKKFYSQNARSADLKQKLRREYGDTYWYYFLYFKSE